MKLERISENQIRCTLTRSDLAERELKISELAYGTEKAKALFREMMVQASDELGFEADNIPLIIEAVPVSNECIMLIVTKVEDPEELDTRFSKFTPSPEDTEDLSDTDDEIYSSADDILDIFKRLGSDILSKTAELHSISGTADLPSDTETTSDDASSEDEEPQKTILRIYEFRTLNEVSCLSEQLPAEMRQYPVQESEQRSLLSCTLQRRRITHCFRQHLPPGFRIRFHTEGQRQYLILF